MRLRRVARRGHDRLGVSVCSQLFAVGLCVTGTVAVPAGLKRRRKNPPSHLIHGRYSREAELQRRAQAAKARKLRMQLKAWEAAVCWDDEYAIKRLAEVRAV